MKENENIVEGYSFSDARDYREAKRELESIEYIKANTDMKDLNKVVKLYNKLIERKTLKTVVGYAFLKELQDRILREGVISKDNLPCIKIEREGLQSRGFGSLESEKERKQQVAIENFRIRLRNSRIINLFLIGIIIAMIIISLLSDRSMISDYENQILDKYSSWEEELNEREEALKEQEKLAE
ncbi:hypothetical protein H0486_06240 [Lachnospiraceae bacterium MD1]|uniref:Uncharacterized protein n=1 Tax=Variimorphobacter saccharofermentans TaxID=2755051 RepID=A0A839JYN9_9FIRM|nr:hypothetical protein [Variimorphobacter saccharofermentans]MBB2182474.1 hypothetical protein [Variimorphobacter saccharofermentans]